MGRKQPRKHEVSAAIDNIELVRAKSSLHEMNELAYG